MTPYTLPRYVLEKELSTAALLTDPQDEGSWTAMCLARTFIMSNPPIPPAKEDNVFDQASLEEMQDPVATQVAFPTLPDYFDDLAKLPGWGTPKPDWIVVAKGTPSQLFQELRRTGVDELDCYFVLSLADAVTAKDFFERHGVAVELWSPRNKDKGACRLPGEIGMPSLPKEVIDYLGHFMPVTT